MPTSGLLKRPVYEAITLWASFGLKTRKKMSFYILYPQYLLKDSKFPINSNYGIKKPDWVISVPSQGLHCRIFYTLVPLREDLWVELLGQSWGWNSHTHSPSEGAVSIQNWKFRSDSRSSVCVECNCWHTGWYHCWFMCLFLASEASDVKGPLQQARVSPIFR